MSRLAVVHHPPGDFWKIPETWKLHDIGRLYTSNFPYISYHLTTQNKSTVLAPLTWFSLLKTWVAFGSPLLPIGFLNSPQFSFNASLNTLTFLWFLYSTTHPTKPAIGFPALPWLLEFLALSPSCQRAFWQKNSV